ncbi:hypothetical protein [Verrucomicrobium spinosum]|uniref:hypothetical protein n=1 Tax=Verrucomicrobium spinosum TaxID=2736 RepID=UPI000B05E1C9|nr:hypothetical protein [Verrucomicrobium spinosum]
MKNLLSLLCATGMLAGLVQPALGSVSLLDGLSFYLDFEGSAPVDTSGKNVVVTNSGVTSNTLTGHYGAIAGVAGNAGYFNRSEKDWLQIGLGYGKLAADPAPQPLAYSFTISAWYYLQPESAPTDRLFLYEGDVDYDLSFGIRGDLASSNGSYVAPPTPPGRPTTMYQMRPTMTRRPTKGPGSRCWRHSRLTALRSRRSCTSTANWLAPPPP